MKVILLLLLSISAMQAEDIFIGPNTTKFTINADSSVAFKIANDKKSAFLSINIFAEKDDSVSITSDDFKDIKDSKANSNIYLTLSDEDKKKDTFTLNVKNPKKDGTATIFANAHLLVVAKNIISKTLKTTITEKDGEFTLSWNSLFEKVNENVNYKYFSAVNDAKTKAVASVYDFLSLVSLVAQNANISDLPHDYETTSLVLNQKGIYSSGVAVIAESNLTGEIAVYENSGPFIACSKIKTGEINSIASNLAYCFDYDSKTKLAFNYWISTNSRPASLAQAFATFYSLDDKKAVIGNEIKAQFSDNKLFDIALDEKTKTGVLTFSNIVAPGNVLSFNLLLKEKDKNRVEVKLGSEFRFYYDESISVIGIKVPPKTSGNIKFTTLSSKDGLVDSIQLFTVENGQEKEVEAAKKEKNYAKLLEGSKIYFLKVTCLTTGSPSVNDSVRVTIRNTDFHEGDNLILYDSEEVKIALKVSTAGPNFVYYTFTENFDKLKFKVINKDVAAGDFTDLKEANGNRITFSKVDYTNTKLPIYILISGSLVASPTSFLVKAERKSPDSLDNIISNNTLLKSKGTYFYQIDKSSDYLSDFYFYTTSKDTKVCISKDSPILEGGVLEKCILQQFNGQILKLDVSQDLLFNNSDLFVSFLINQDIKINAFKSKDQYETISKNKVSFINLKSNQKQIIRIETDANLSLYLSKSIEVGIATLKLDNVNHVLDEFEAPTFVDSIQVADDYSIIDKATAQNKYRYLLVEAGAQGFIGRIHLLEATNNINVTGQANYFFFTNTDKSDEILTIDNKFAKGLNYLVIRSYGQDATIKVAGKEIKLSKGQNDKVEFEVTGDNGTVITVVNNKTSQIVLLFEAYLPTNKQNITADISKPIALTKKLNHYVFSIKANAANENKLNLFNFLLNDKIYFTNFAYQVVSEATYLSTTTKNFYSLSSENTQVLLRDVSQNSANISVSSQSTESYLIVYLATSSENSSLTVKNTIISGKAITDTLTVVDTKVNNQAFLLLQPAASSKKGLLTVYKANQNDKCVVSNSGNQYYINDQQDAHIVYTDTSDKVVNIHCSSAATLKIKAKPEVDATYVQDKVNTSLLSINYTSYTTEVNKSRKIILNPKPNKYLDGIAVAKVKYYYFAFDSINDSSKLNSIHFIDNKDKAYTKLEELQFTRNADKPFRIFVVAHDENADIVHKYDFQYVKNYNEINPDVVPSDDSSASDDEKFAGWKIALIVIGSVLFVGLVVLAIVCIRKRKTGDKNEELL